MSEIITYAFDGSIATITMDDGKVNALSPAMLADVMAAFATAEADAAKAVVLTGRATTLSAGFDLRTDPAGWPAMLTAGARLAERVMSFPAPVVVACNGNAIAMGGFLVLAADYRVGAAGEFRIGLNEVAIGMTIPWFGLAIAEHRLPRPYFDRCTVTGTLLGPDEAVTAGFLDRVVAHEDVLSTANAVALELSGVNPQAHLNTKLRVREHALAGVRDGIDRIETREIAEW